MGRVNKSQERINLICDECKVAYSAMLCTDRKHMDKYGMHLCRSCARKGSRNPFYGYRFSEEKRNEFSEIRKTYYDDSESGSNRREEQRQRFLGEKNPMYKGAELRSDYTTRNRYPRERTLERDANTCRKCTGTYVPKSLIAHHLNSCNKCKDGRMDINNMVTLCKECHK